MADEKQNIRDREQDEKGMGRTLKDAAGDFSLFITNLSMQALVSLGEVPNPVDNKKEQNLSQAAYFIDTLDMLKKKTQNNLSPEEAKLIDEMLYTLRVKYLELSKKDKNHS